MATDDGKLQAIVQALLAPQFKPVAPLAAAPAAPTFLGMLPSTNARPDGAMPVIDPGMTWGGHDVNVMHPDAFMTNQVYNKPLDQEDL